MPPIWLCLDCDGVAYGWARTERCIYCDASRVLGTDEVYHGEEHPADYRLVFIPPKQWAQLEAEAILAGQSTRELISQREGTLVILIRDEPVQRGKLVLLKRKREKVSLS